VLVEVLVLVLGLVSVDESVPTLDPMLVNVSEKVSICVLDPVSENA